MRRHLDPPIRVAGRFLSVVSEVEVKLDRCGQAIIGYGHKRPRMILVLEDGQLTALDLDGRRLSRSDIDEDLAGEMERLVADQERG